jgi:hypothetical protein
MPAAARRGYAKRAIATLLALAVAMALTPGVASADAPSAPVASAYLARLTPVPAGVRAKVVDGYVRMWLSVPARDTLVVLDYRGVPYLRFARAGVAVNERSEMYFLNATPVAQAPPPGLQRSPRWVQVSGRHSYEWHDARLSALTTVALSPGQSYVGRWRIPVVLGGRLTSVSGGVWHAADPSIVWFWAIFAVCACTLAGWRVRSSRLDQRLARLLALPALGGIALASLSLELHGRPNVPVSQYVELAVILAFVAWALVRVSTTRPGYLTHFAIAFLAFWKGIELIESLLRGFVLLALPATITRVATVLCLGFGAALALIAFRLADEPLVGGSRQSRSADEPEEQDQLQRAAMGR